ncbi:MAG TPA: transposase [Myxococcota bacterium]|nr:transposase [Myxococcota bacterium]
MHHVRRGAVPAGCPVHVTLRVRAGIGSLRTRRFVRSLNASLREASERGNSRVVHFSVQRDHLHMILEAASKQALGSVVKSFSARVARTIHRVFGRRGQVLLGRYHVRAAHASRGAERDCLRPVERAKALGTAARLRASGEARRGFVGGVVQWMDTLYPSTVFP